MRTVEGGRENRWHIPRTASGSKGGMLKDEAGKIKQRPARLRNLEAWRNL